MFPATRLHFTHADAVSVSDQKSNWTLLNSQTKEKLATLVVSDSDHRSSLLWKLMV
jgi:hypothetical protein